MIHRPSNPWCRAQRRALLAGALLPGILMMPAAVRAQAAPEGQEAAQAAQAGQAAAAGDDIVVTANRQAQVLSRVPASIVAKNQVELDKQGVRSITDLARLTPGVTFGQSTTAFGTGQSTIAIRGVDSSSGIPTTGVYIDDTPVQTRTGVSPSLSNAYPQVFDLDRVEVLRGPQGTLFGSGSVGGAVRFISPGPDYLATSLYGRAEVAATENGAPSYEVGLAGGTPLQEDKIGLRASVWYRRDGGYIDRLDRFTQKVTQRDINSQESLSARLAIGWKVTDTLTITPSLFFQDLHYDDGSRYELATSDPSRARYNLSLNVLPEYRKDRFYLPAVKASLDLGGMTLVSDTSYFTRTTRSASDDATLSLAIYANIPDRFVPAFADYTPTTLNHTKQKAFTQELRLQNANSGARLNWIAGLFYQHSNVYDQYGGQDPRLLDVVNYNQVQNGLPPYASLSDNPQFGVELYQGKYSTYQRNIHVDDQKAVYAQADYEVVPRVKLTAGARYTIADYRYDGFTAGPLFATAGKVDQLKVTSRTVTPKFGIAFQADSHNLFYATAAKGIRGPGVSPAVGTSCAADAAAIGFNPAASNTINPDSVWSYEAGSKNRLLGGKLLVDASVYRVKWKNVQTLLVLPICQQQVMLNLGDAQVDGFDLALTVRPAPGLSLGAAVSYIDARYTTDIPGAGGTIIRRAGEPLPAAPWSVQLNGEYSHPIGADELYLRGDYAYTSHNDTPLNLSSPLVDPALPRAPATSLLNLRLGMRLKTEQKDSIDLSLFVNNVTDSHPVLALYHDTLASTRYRAATFRPRTIGLTATFRR
ncbi:TonB-dependent receptor [Sphingomonas azotifigens]|uniref:TonB-dependent receptor n=1 Tax=Sphingomonas azotifigens TaxID=330920 RepID=UPI000A026D7D|nr:TonB-dependent receptor [Sphingomonas azotifigens]